MGQVGQYGALWRRYLAPQWPRVLLMSLLLLASIGLQALAPQVIRRFIDRLTTGASESALTAVALLFLGVVVGGQLITALATWVSATVGWRATNALRADLVRACLGLDLSFHQQHAPGALIERVDGDVATLNTFFSQFIIQIAGNALLIVAVLALVVATDWRAGLPLVLYAVVALLVLLRVQRGVGRVFRGLRQQTTALSGFWEEWLTAREDLQANGATPHLARRNLQQLRHLQRWGRGLALRWRGSIATIAILFAVGNALAFVIGATLYRAGDLTIGGVYFLLASTNLLATHLGGVASYANDWQLAAVALARVTDLTGTRSALVDGHTSLPDDTTAPEVAFDRVSFAYTPGVPVLRDVSFTVPPGQTLGIVGRTGSGKSTLARLLFRFADPEVGTIRLAGRDLRDLRLATLRGAIGLVTQQVELFRASVRDNLTFFDTSIPDARIVATLRDLGLDGWLARLPDGLDSLLDGTGGLSAGEAQLLAFARVFLQQPGVVVLDEASSRLDPATETLIEAAVTRLLAGRTALVIAHRLSTLARADLILVLDGGRVVEYGPRAALAADPASHFATLLRAQAGALEVTS